MLIKAMSNYFLLICFGETPKYRVKAVVKLLAYA